MTQFAEEALKVMGGVVQAIIRKEMREFRESLLPVAVNETILSGRYAVVEGISSLGVLELCGYGKGQRPKGSSQFVTRRLVRYHVLRSSQVRFPSVGGSVVHLFDEMTSREWLSSGGKTEIDHFVAQKRGQGRLRLIAKPTLAEIAKDRLRDRRA
ncbi:MAG TPA: hypothetical protein VE053_06805 [Allosphingosinicella sp.]|nr:hypothetical protein [Allosphingosinicella sp.]